LVTLNIPGGDRHVHVDRVDVAPERAIGLAARDHGASMSTIAG